MTQMSITRALVQLKRLEGQISKATNTDFAFLLIKDSAKETVMSNPSLNKESAAKEGKSNLDKVVGLIEKRRDIKAAIVKSNANTIIEINNVKMTVAEAIELKHTIKFKRELRDKLVHQRAVILRKEEQTKEVFQEKLDKRLKIEADGGSDSNTLDSVKASFEKNNSVEFINLKMIEDQIKNLEAEIEAVETDLDQILTESNSITTIEI